MIVLEVDLVGVAILKRKRESPIPVDLHSPRTGPVPFQLVQTEMRQGNIFERCRRVNHVQSSGGIPRLLLVSKKSPRPLCLNDRIIFRVVRSTRDCYRNCC